MPVQTMPKGHRSVRSQGYYRVSPATTPTTATYPPISARPSSLQQEYYSSSLNTPMSHQTQTYSSLPTYASGGPVQHPLSSHSHTSAAYNPNPLPVSHSHSQPMTSIRPSSGAWNPQDDQTLMAARAQGMNWAPIQQNYFPSKTPNACRKRHERLMERRNADDWDGMKLENLAKSYMGMRREIWSGLAAQTGEKWNVVEQKCMSQGLKNLATAARACSRRERLHDTSSAPSLSSLPNSAPYAPGEDSGLGLDDLDDQYENDGVSEHSGGSGGMGLRGGSGGSVGYDRGDTYRGDVGVGYERGVSGDEGTYYGHQSQGSSGSSGRSVGHGHGYGQRLPSIDMGIGAIINRPNGR